MHAYVPPPLYQCLCIASSTRSQHIESTLDILTQILIKNDIAMGTWVMSIAECPNFRKGFVSECTKLKFLLIGIESSKM